MSFLKQREIEVNRKIDLRVAEIFRELAVTTIAWPNLTLEEHLNNAAKKLEDGEF